MLDSAIFAAMFTDRPSRWHSLPASTAALMPPSLISLSDMPPAPARALALDVGERMDALVDPDRHLGRISRAS